MKVKYLIEHLKMFGEDAEVYITTCPNDLCQPIKRSLITMINARQDEKYGFQEHKVLLTACIPTESR